MNVNKIRTRLYTTFLLIYQVSPACKIFEIFYWKPMDPETLMFDFNASTTTKMDESDNAMIQMALKQVESTLKELGIFRKLLSCD